MERWQDWLWLQFLFARHDIVRFLRRVRLIRPETIDPPMLRPAPVEYERPPFRSLGIQMVGQPEIGRSPGSLGMAGYVGPAGTGETLTIDIPDALSQATLWFFETDKEPNPTPRPVDVQTEDEKLEE